MATLKTPAKSPSNKLKAGKKRKISKWIILAGVAAIAIVGVVVVRYSSASTAKTFVRSCSGGGLQTRGGRKVLKGGQACQIALESGDYAYGRISTAQAKSSARICADVKVDKAGTMLIIRGAHSYSNYLWTDQGRARYNSTGSVRLCQARGNFKVWDDPEVQLQVSGGNASVTQIYGLPN